MLKTTRDSIFLLLVSITAGVYVSRSMQAKTLIFVIVAAVLAGLFVFAQETRKEILTDTNDSRKESIAQLTGTNITYIPDNVVDIFYDTRLFYDYNPRVYTVTLKHINNFMHLASDFQKGGITECKNTVRIARGLYLDAMNSYHSLIISIPSVKGDLLVKLHTKKTQALQNILYSELLQMQQVCGVPDSDSVITGTGGMYSETELLGDSGTPYNVYV